MVSPKCSKSQSSNLTVVRIISEETQAGFQKKRTRVLLRQMPHFDHCNSHNACYRSQKQHANDDPWYLCCLEIRLDFPAPRTSYADPEKNQGLVIQLFLPLRDASSNVWSVVNVERFKMSKSKFSLLQFTENS